MAALPPERPGHTGPEELLTLRAALAKAFEAGASGTRDEREIGGVRTLCFGDPAAEMLMIHFHGGGYRQGQPEMVAAYAAAVAEQAGIEVWCPAYRLAPECPFPAALHDGLRLLEAGAGRRLVLAGDSAGGGLAAALAALCGERGVRLAGLVLHSPWLDLRVADDCYRRNAASDPLFSHAAATAAAQLYLQGHPADDPLASPGLGEVTEFPPTFISVGTGEVLHADALALDRRLRAAGRAVQLCEVPGMDHVAVTRGLQNEGAPRVLAETVSFLETLR